MKKKPKIRYVDMCIYIDEHIYEKDHDVEKIFDYLQMLFYALATKKRFFHKERDYDEYSLYAASNLYMRLTNKNQFLPDDDPKKIPKIKSVLNYIKKTLYPMKVNYQQDNFDQVMVDEIHGEGLSEVLDSNMESMLRSGTDGLLQVEVTEYLSSIPKIIKKFLQETPYSNDRKMMHNLYISCLITLLRSVTLSNYNHSRLFKNDEYKLSADNMITDMMYEESVNAPIAWHLDKGMEDYVGVLVNKIKKLIIRGVRDLIQSYDLSEDIIKDILMSPLSQFNEEIDD